MSNNASSGTAAVKEYRTRRVTVRVNESEWNEIVNMEKTLSRNRSEIVRDCVLQHFPAVLVNINEVLLRLDTIGVSVGEMADGVGRLARYAGSLETAGELEPEIMEKLSALMADYIAGQRSLEQAFRQLIRLIRRRK